MFASNLKPSENSNRTEYGVDRVFVTNSLLNGNISTGTRWAWKAMSPRSTNTVLLRKTGETGAREARNSEERLQWWMARCGDIAGGKRLRVGRQRDASNDWHSNGNQNSQDGSQASGGRFYTPNAAKAVRYEKRFAKRSMTDSHSSDESQDDVITEVIGERQSPDPGTRIKAPPIVNNKRPSKSILKNSTNSPKISRKSSRDGSTDQKISFANTSKRNRESKDSTKNKYFDSIRNSLACLRVRSPRRSGCWMPEATEDLPVPKTVPTVKRRKVRFLTSQSSNKMVKNHVRPFDELTDDEVKFLESLKTKKFLK